jgi:hypothetical protein
MRTAMLPLVDIVGGDGLLADESVDTAFATITDVFDLYGRDLMADSGHVLMIGETGYALNYSKLDPQTSIEIGRKVPYIAILNPAKCSIYWGKITSD